MSSDYTESLKSIKEAEEASSRAISEKKKSLTEMLEKVQREADAELNAARKEAEAYVIKQVNFATSSSESESKKLLQSAKVEAESIAKKKLGKVSLKKIVEETVLSEFTGV